MCSWCWGFQPCWQKTRTLLPQTLPVKYLCGGLAPDTNEPMPESQRRTIQKIWQQIETRIPVIQFNFDFWSQNLPKRSTYISCRAVIAARLQHPQYEKPMISAIQQAYYQQAKNPCEAEILYDLAEQLGLDEIRFAEDLNSPHVKQLLSDEILLAKKLGATGFPSLILVKEDQIFNIDIDYTRPEIVAQQINSKL